jgi:hypothetical protein
MALNPPLLTIPEVYRQPGGTVTNGKESVRISLMSSKQILIFFNWFCILMPHTKTPDENFDLFGET